MDKPLIDLRLLLGSITPTATSGVSMTATILGRDILPRAALSIVELDRDNDLWLGEGVSGKA